MIEDRWINKRRHVYAYLASRRCLCGEDDPVVLEFHHRDPSTKLGNISDMLVDSSTMEQLISEIEKCDVLCANCHRRLTARENGHWKSLVYEDLDFEFMPP